MHKEQNTKELRTCVEDVNYLIENRNGQKRATKKQIGSEQAS